MSKIKRGAVRSEGDLEVQLTLRDHLSGEALAESLTGHLHNVSVAGANLSITHIRTGGYHIFYTAKESTKPILYIESATTDEENNSFSIPVHPVWFNCEGSDAARAFKMGVEFMKDHESDDIRGLVKKACGKQIQGGNWLSRNFCTLISGLKGLFAKKR